MDLNYLLPLTFAGLMALSILVYALLDGYDLGVGLMLPRATEAQRDMMIASIGPFWDANETWLVLGVGLLLIAFPSAHSYVLGNLYLPVLVLLVGLILRGVAFDFRAKVPVRSKAMWDRLFFVGSLLATTSQPAAVGAQDSTLPFDYDYAAEEAIASTIDVDNPDPDQLREIFAKRRARVIDAMPEGATIIFSVERAQEEVGHDLAIGLELLGAQLRNEVSLLHAIANPDVEFLDPD